MSGTRRQSVRRDTLLIGVLRSGFLAIARLRAFVKRLVLFSPLDGPVAALVIRFDRLVSRRITGPSTETATTVGAQTLVMPPHLPSQRQLCDGTFEPDVTALIRSVLTKGQSIVDLGANIGYYSVIAASIVGSGGFVYAFEPDPEAYHYLQRNVALNRLGNVIPVRKAVADRVAAMAFIRSELERGHLTDGAQPLATLVDATTLDDYFASAGWPRVDLIKMDIEGGEAAALRGMTELSRRNPTLQLVMEFNLTAIQRAGTTPAVLACLLRELGFRSAYVIEQGLRRVPITQGLPVSRALYNLLLTKQSFPG